MPIMTFVQKHPQSGVYRYRRRVPKHLKPIIGRHELLFSLETKDRREAMRRASARNLVVEAEYLRPAEKALEWGVSLEAARQRISEDKRPVPVVDGDLVREVGAHQTARSLQLDDELRFGQSAPALRGLLWAALEWGIKAYEEASSSGFQGKDHLKAFQRSLLRQAEEARQRGDSLSGRAAEQGQAWPWEDLAAYRRLMQLAQVGLRAGLATGDLRAIEPLARERLTELGVDGSPAAVQALTVELARARLNAVEMILRRTEGEPIPTPEAHDPSVSRFMLSDVFDIWVRMKTPQEGSKAEVLTAIRQFEELHGRLSVASITRSHARAYRDALMKVPSVRKRAELKMTLPELVEVGNAEPNRPRLSGQSINKRLALLKAMVQTARDEDAFSASRSWENPFARITVAESEWTSRRPFSEGDLGLIFGKLCDPGVRTGRQFGLARTFLPLMSLCLGTRIGELVTLRASDFSEQGGSWFVSFNEDHEDKSLKTRSSRRIVPLHPLLSASGLLQVVEWAKRTGGSEGRLFPAVSSQADNRGEAAPFVQWFSRFLRNDVGITDDLKTLHSFRHTFKTACRGAGLPEDVSDFFTGHADGKVSRRYGEFPLGQLTVMMARVSFPEGALQPFLEKARAEAIEALTQKPV